MLALIMAAWVRISALLLAVALDITKPPIEAFTGLFSSADGIVTVIEVVATGFILVLSVFVASAVAIPLILDKDVDFITAVQTSYKAVKRSLAAMMLWAGLILTLTAIGILTAFVGFAVIFPVLGYATWHSYRSIVRQ